MFLNKVPAGNISVSMSFICCKGESSATSTDIFGYFSLIDFKSTFKHS